jgi:hypothetical protein
MENQKQMRQSISEQEIRTLVQDWHDRWLEGDLRQERLEMETKAMERKLR